MQNLIRPNTPPGAARIDCAALLTAFSATPAHAWLSLSELSPEELRSQAIDYACHLRELSGRDYPWGCILTTWTNRLAERVALLTLAEAGAFDDDRRDDELRGPTPALVIVASKSTPGVTYRTRTDGSHCTCPGYGWRGRCSHTDDQAAFDPRVDADARYAA